MTPVESKKAELIETESRTVTRGCQCRAQVWLLAAQKVNTRETSAGEKGKVALFRRPATWEDGGLKSSDGLQVAS